MARGDLSRLKRIFEHDTSAGRVPKWNEAYEILGLVERRSGRFVQLNWQRDLVTKSNKRESEVAVLFVSFVCFFVSECGCKLVSTLWRWMMGPRKLACDTGKRSGGEHRLGEEEGDKVRLNITSFLVFRLLFRRDYDTFRGESGTAVAPDKRTRQRRGRTRYSARQVSVGGEGERAHVHD